MNNAVLQCDNLSKTYLDSGSPIVVLKNLNFSIAQSEMVSIVGSSGSGKSTLLHILAGLDKPSDGVVTINGKNPFAVDEAQRCYIRNHYLGFIYQHHHLLPEFSALENTCMPLLLRKDSVKTVKAKALDLLDKIGLAKRADHKIGQLSGGERQRVAIARALITNPLCILADEPTGNLDPQNASMVLELFFSLQKSFKTSVIMVTHDLSIAKRAHRVLNLQNGELHV